ncbi:MAG: hypothetical protein JO256_00185 [Alphaproteobacteria bacterium]|nr:hypothetical protein [Alphaproteobacteria bacterium]
MKAKSIMTGVTAAVLLVSSAVADIAPLPSGKPAGTKQATLLGLTGLPLVALIAAVSIAIVAAAGGFDNSTTATSGTGS